MGFPVHELHLIIKLFHGRDLCQILHALPHASGIYLGVFFAVGVAVRGKIPESCIIDESSLVKVPFHLVCPYVVRIADINLRRKGTNKNLRTMIFFEFLDKPSPRLSIGKLVPSVRKFRDAPVPDIFLKSAVVLLRKDRFRQNSCNHGLSPNLLVLRNMIDLFHLP